VVQEGMKKMKKLLGILVLGLLVCNIAIAEFNE